MLFPGGDVRELDFQFHVGDKKIGAPFHGLKAFFTTPQLSTTDKVHGLKVPPQRVPLDQQHEWSRYQPCFPQRFCGFCCLVLSVTKSRTFMSGLENIED